MAKLGYLYLKNGKWADKQIVTRAYVRQSTKELIDIPAKYKDFDERYGYLWWAWTCAGYPLYTAAGWNGQYISVIPKLDLVVALTGVAGGISPKPVLIISDYVIKAIVD
jgi:CubicO group peptidase (beta-lactamase class C family)